MDPNDDHRQDLDAEYRKKRRQLILVTLLGIATLARIVLMIHQHYK